MVRINWQDDVIPKECIKFRLDKKQGSTAINGIETAHNPNAQELIDCSPIRTPNMVFKDKAQALKSIREELNNKGEKHCMYNYVNHNNYWKFNLCCR
jgi:hypothetical protein